MTGTLVNVAGIILGSLIGLFLKRGIPERINEVILKVQGLAIAIIGLGGVLSAMLSADTATGKITNSRGLLLLISLVIGCVCGEALRIDDRLNGFGLWVENRLKAEGFAKGFVTATLIFTIGAMSVIGPINDGLTGDASLLYIKSTLDGIMSVMLASVFGVGVLFSFVPVLILQSIPALLARQIAPFLSEELLSSFCMVGYASVLCIGINFLFGPNIKAANLLPSLLVPIVYYFCRLLFAFPL